MSILVVLVGIVVIAVPIAWIVSEFRAKKRSTRISLGVMSILCSFGVAWLAAQVVRLNYNAWYGFASQELIDETISQLEQGHYDHTLKELKQLRSDFDPTYEGRAHYDELVKETVQRMEKGK